MDSTIFCRTFCFPRVPPRFSLRPLLGCTILSQRIQARTIFSQFGFHLFKMSLHWNGFSAITSLNSSDVRNIATTIFWVLTTLITVTGTLLLSHRNQYKLLRRKDFIPLNHLSPWMSDLNAFIYCWKTKRLPGGRYGILMLLTSAFALGSHFIVGRYISSQPLQGL